MAACFKQVLCHEHLVRNPLVSLHRQNNTAIRLKKGQ